MDIGKDPHTGRQSKQATVQNTVRESNQSPIIESPETKQKANPKEEVRVHKQGRYRNRQADTGKYGQDTYKSGQETNRWV